MPSHSRSDGPQADSSRLQVPIEAAVSFLRDRIAEGTAYRDQDVQTSEQLRDLERAVNRWRDKVRTWLDVNLGGEGAKEFRDATTHYGVGGRLSDSQELDFLRKELANETSKIESILDRLEIWAPVPAVSKPAAAGSSAPSEAATIFIVHGSDTPRAEQVARTVEKYTGRDAVILHLEPNGGKTVIEKLEANAAVALFAVIILSGDDVGSRAVEPYDLKPRGRQNVVFEMGFFFGHIGRANTCVLFDTSVEKPSDIGGLVYVALDDAEAWKAKLQLELKAAGLARS